MPRRYFDNARLAIDLALKLGAKGTDSGTMSNFSVTPPDWRCPACGRTKAMIAKLDKNGNFYCALHLHHDHLYEGICEMLGIAPYSFDREMEAALESLVRFAPQYVCMDCNMAEGRAKKAVGAASYFSFNAFEIGQMLAWQDGNSHAIDVAMAKEIHERVIGDVVGILETAEGTLFHVCPASLENAIGQSAQPPVTH